MTNTHGHGVKTLDYWRRRNVESWTQLNWREELQIEPLQKHQQQEHQAAALSEEKMYYRKVLFLMLDAKRRRHKSQQPVCCYSLVELKPSPLTTISLPPCYFAFSTSSVFHWTSSFISGLSVLPITPTTITHLTTCLYTLCNGNNNNNDTPPSQISSSTSSGSVQFRLGSSQPTTTSSSRETAVTTGPLPIWVNSIPIHFPSILPVTCCNEYAFLILLTVTYWLGRNAIHKSHPPCIT